MILKLNKLCCTSIVIFCFFFKNSFAEIVKKIEIIGNDRVSSETILMFASVKEKQDLSIQDLNDITIKLYDTNFFENIDVSLNNQKLTITVIENPIIGNIIIEGIKSKSLKAEINKQLSLKGRSSLKWSKTCTTSFDIPPSSLIVFDVIDKVDSASS